MCSWEEIGEKWSRAQQMGWQAIQAALDVGDELNIKKLETPKGEWGLNLKTSLNRPQASANVVAAQLMRLALHRNLIEEHKPESMQRALMLLPKVPTKTSDKQLTIHKEEVDKYAAFANEDVKAQAEILAQKLVKVELERLQNQAHDAVMAELKAVKQQLSKERQRISEMMTEAAEQRQFYEDLINKRTNGQDLKQTFKTLRQALHPDRPETSRELRKKAYDALDPLGRFVGV